MFISTSQIWFLLLTKFRNIRMGCISENYLNVHGCISYFNLESKKQLPGSVVRDIEYGSV